MVYVLLNLRHSDLLRLAFVNKIYVISTVLDTIIQPIRRFSLYESSDLRRKWNTCHNLLNGSLLVDLSSLPFYVQLSTIPCLRPLFILIFGAVPSILCTKKDGEVYAVNYI
jgi:hypothetical protein